MSQNQNWISIRFSSRNSSQKLSIELGPWAWPYPHYYYHHPRRHCSGSWEYFPGKMLRGAAMTWLLRRRRRPTMTPPSRYSSGFAVRPSANNLQLFMFFLRPSTIWSWSQWRDQKELQSLYDFCLRKSMVIFLGMLVTSLNYEITVWYVE